VDAHVVEGDDVRVGHRADQPRFTLEALHEVAVAPSAFETTLMATSPPSRVSLAR
jgi:hypothetical protein